MLRFVGVRSIDGSAVCATCSVAIRRHQPCAVCFSTNAHTRLCRHCQTQHEALGIEWNEEDDAATGEGSDIGGDERLQVTVALAELAGRQRRRRPAPKAALVVQLLLVREEVTVRRVDAQGRFRGLYRRRNPIGKREIARLAGVSYQYVKRLTKSHFRASRDPAR